MIKSFNYLNFLQGFYCSTVQPLLLIYCICFTMIFILFPVLYGKFFFLKFSFANSLDFLWFLFCLPLLDCCALLILCLPFLLRGILCRLSIILFNLCMCVGCLPANIVLGRLLRAFFILIISLFLLFNLLCGLFSSAYFHYNVAVVGGCCCCCCGAVMLPALPPQLPPNAAVVSVQQNSRACKCL